VSITWRGTDFDAIREGEMFYNTGNGVIYVMRNGEPYAVSKGFNNTKGWVQAPLDKMMFERGSEVVKADSLFFPGRNLSWKKNK
jgi:hypothetical protein